MASIFDIQDNVQRTGQWREHPTIWEPMKYHWENQLNSWAQIQFVKKSLVPNEFLETYMDVLALYVARDDLETLASAWEKDVVPDDDTLQRVMDASVCCSSLFSKEGVRLNYLAWVERIEQDLKTLVGNGLIEEDIEHFKNIHREEANNMKEMGVKVFDKLHKQVSFLAQEVSPERTALNDEWRLPLEALLRTVAISNRQVDRTPFELLAFGTGYIVEEYRTLKAPDYIIKDMVGPRKQVNRILEGQRTIKDMIKTLSPHFKSIVNGAGDFNLEIDFLINHAQTIITSRAHGLILSAFPQLTRKRIQEQL